MKICYKKLIVLIIFISFSRWHCFGELEETHSHKNDKFLEPSSRTKINEINPELISAAMKQTYTLHGLYKPHTLPKSSLLSNNVKKRPISFLFEVKSGIMIRKSKILQEDDLIQASIENVKNVEATTTPSKTQSVIKSSQYSVKNQVSDDENLNKITSNQVQSTADSNIASQTINQESIHESKNAENEENKEWIDKTEKSNIEKTKTESEEQKRDEIINMDINSEKSSENLSKEAGKKSETTQNTHSEVMPSFDEWKKMMLAEQEKDGHKIQPLSSVSGKKIISHKRRHNYASYECGAKIVAVNNEAEGTNHILNEMVDEYMLNPCKAKIWFVIELCESIQVSQIELANFELFSSSPKEFSISWSDRFPTREWTSLGTITVEDQRTLQGFNLQHQGYGKFIKFELLNHYGTEHYCPISVIRVFGTSMVDEYEEMETAEISHHINEDDDDRLDLPLTEEPSSSQDLFGSAKEVVINIVKKAAQVLSRDQEQENDSQSLEGLLDSQSSLQTDCERFLNCTTNMTVKDTISLPLPSSIIPYLEYCESCSFRVDNYQSHVESTSLCQFIFVLFGPLVFENFCKQHKILPIDFSHLESTITPTLVSTERESSEHEVKTELTEKLLESKNQESLHSTDSESVSMQPYTHTEKSPLVSEKLDSSEITNDLQKSIQPTKTIQISSKLHKESFIKEIKSDDKPVSEKLIKEETRKEIRKYSQNGNQQTFTMTDIPELSDTEIISQSIQLSNLEESKVENTDTEIIQNDTETTYQAEAIESLVLSTPIMQQLSEGASTSAQDLQFTKDEIEKYENGALKTEPIFVGIPSPPGQKESVFMRMGNRIKALELNMSLSSQYLQELSQRYRRQMEDMQKAFNRTIGTLNDTARKAAVRDLHQQEVIGQLQAEITNLTNAVDILLRERQSAHRQMLEMHICLMVIEAIVMITVLSLCVRRLTLSLNQFPSDSHPSEFISSKMSSSPHRGRKRSANDTQSSELHTNYLIVEPSVPIVIEPPPKVKKKHHRNKKKNQQMKCNQKTTDSCNFNYFSSLNNCDINSAASLDQKSTVERTKDSVNCENNFDIKQNIQKRRERERLGSVPLQNLTNGQRYNDILPEASDDKFSFKKFLRLQKKNSF